MKDVIVDIIFVFIQITAWVGCLILMADALFDVF